MDTFPGEHDETDWSKIIGMGVSLLFGVVVGGLLTTWTYTDEVENLRVKISYAHEERDLERAERKVFQDGMIGCFEHIGKKP